MSGANAAIALSQTPTGLNALTEPEIALLAIVALAAVASLAGRLQILLGGVSVTLRERAARVT